MNAASDELVIDAAGLPADVATVDALARLQLAAHRAGRRVRLTDASPDLIRLIRLCGLDRTLNARAP